LSELEIGLLSLHVLGDSNLLSLGLVNGWEGEHSAHLVLRGLLNLLLSGIWDFTLLQLSFVLWEKNEFSFVVGQSFNVSILHVSVFVVSSVVNGDSNSLGEGWSKFGILKFSEREASSELDLTGIFLSHSENEWSKLANWSWEAGSSFFGSFVSSDLLVSFLVEEASNDSLVPMLSQMRALNDIIVFYHVAY